MAGLTIPVVISVYADRTFSFITKTPPAPVLLLKAAGIEKGSGTPNKEKKGKVTEKQIIATATQKMPAMNAPSADAAANAIPGPPRPPCTNDAAPSIPRHNAGKPRHSR